MQHYWEQNPNKQANPLDGNTSQQLQAYSHFSPTNLTILKFQLFLLSSVTDFIIHLLSSHRFEAFI